LKNATLKKRVMATLVSATVAFGGVAVAAPSADADIRITSQYSAVDSTAEQAALQFSREFAGDHQANLLPTQYGAGWCIDLDIPSPAMTTAYDVRRLDGTSGLYGFNGDFTGDLKIHPDIEKAAISLTKVLISTYNEGNGNKQAVKDINYMLQGLLSNHQATLDKIRAQVRGNATWHANFIKWTGFEIRKSYDGHFYLAKVGPTPNAKAGEYVTVLVPRNYNVYRDRNQEPTTQRIVLIGQPGLDGIKPNIIKETKTVVVPAPPVTKTVTQDGPTITVTRNEIPVPSLEYQIEQPTITVTETKTPVTQVVSTVKKPDVTLTATRRPDVVTATETLTKQRETETVTSTLPQQTVTVTEKRPTYTTVTQTVQPTVTNTQANQTAVVTKTVDPVIKTVQTTAPAETQTLTVTAAPETRVVETRVTETNRTEISRTSVVERYIRKYFYAFDFSSTKDSQTIEVEGLDNWQIDFVDDSQGLVKVEKVLENGKYVLKVTPVKEGRGTVRIFIVDNQGNRHEYSINVVNEAVKTQVTNEVVVNNHFFNVGVGSLEHFIPVPKGWKYKVDGAATAVNENEQGFTLKINEGVIRGTVTVEVYQVNAKGENTGAKDVYTFNVDTSQNQFSQTRVIGNENPYILEVKNVEQEPEKVSGGELIEKIEKNEQGFWVITPVKGKEGEAVVRAEDKDGNVYTFTLVIKEGTNVAVDVEVHSINQGDSVDITVAKPEDYELKLVSGNEKNWGWTPSGSGWTITNKQNDTATFELRTKGENGRPGVVVGVYTIVAKVVQAQLPDPIKVSRDVLDRNTIDLKPGDKENNTFVITKGDDLVQELKKNDDGTWVIQPKLGVTGDIVVEEQIQGKAVVEYTLHVTPGGVSERTRDVKSSSDAYIYGTNKLNLEIVEGKDLVAGIVEGNLTFKPGAQGRVEIENRNSRGVAFERLIYNVTAAKATPKRFDLKWNAEATISVPKGYTYTVDKPELVEVIETGNSVLIKPKPGASGTVTVTVRNGEHVTEIYELTLIPRKNGEGTSTISERYKLTVGGKVTIIRNNDNEIAVEGDGAKWVTIDKSTGKWVLVPNGPESAEKTVTIVERRDNVVVKRYVVDIVNAPKPLEFTEERRVVVETPDSYVKKGEPTNQFKVVRGRDEIEEPKLDPQGNLTVIPKPGKAPRVVVEETDREGNLVRIIELDFNATPGEVTPDPKVRWTLKREDITGDRDKGYNIPIKGSENAVEISFCNAAGACTIVVPDPKSVTTKPGGSDVKVEPGIILPGTEKMKVVPIKNGILDLDAEVEVIVEGGAKISGGDSETGSSELDPKCIAALVGLSVPLLLAIPVGILSQVQIPGLEGVSAQINDAIRQANDQIQRGLGIYDRDRAERAAGVQGAFQAVNPEMLGLAGGALGAITVGLLILDGVLRACGQEEATSSYQLGKATKSDVLMNGSSGKSAATTQPATTTTKPTAEKAS